MLNVRREIRDTALGNKKADLIIENGKLVNVYTDEIYQANVAIKGNRIAYVGDVNHTKGSKTQVIDASDKHILPGFIDAHYHMGGAQLSMTRWAETLIMNGSTSVATDIYEIGSVAGKRGIRFALDEAKEVGLNILFLIPTVAFMQHNPFGNSKRLSEEDLFEMINWPETIGINEPTPEWLVDGDDAMLKLANEALLQGKIIEGHAPEISGKRLQAYITMGPGSDHESLDASEAIMKLRLGMEILMREGSGAADMENVIRALTKNKMPTDHFMFCTDDRDIVELYELGHLNYTLKKAIKQGINPVTAIKMATINPARYLQKETEIGNIAPGRLADILLVSDLSELKMDLVISKGEIVVENGIYNKSKPKLQYPKYMKCEINLKEPINLEDLAITTKIKKDSIGVRVLHCIDGSLVSERREAVLKLVNGVILPDVTNDVAKMVVVERHRGTGLIGKAFVSGFGLKHGAFAQTFNPVTNNIVALGTSDECILAAIQKIIEVGGGFVVIDGNQKLLASLHLPILGILSDQPIDVVYNKTKTIFDAIHKLGSSFKSPIISLGFMAMAYGIPTYKLSEYGLVDVEKSKIVNVIKE